jgi:hypothetical protein
MVRKGRDVNAKTANKSGDRSNSGGCERSNWVDNCQSASEALVLRRHTSTTATVRSSLFRLNHTSRPNQAASAQRTIAHIRSPVVPHHLSPISTRSIPEVSKLAPIAHQPQMNSENGIETAVATRTGRTVFCSRNRKAAGRTSEGMTRTRRSGMRGMIDGVVFSGTSFGGYILAPTYQRPRVDLHL